MNHTATTPPFASIGLALRGYDARSVVATPQALAERLFVVASGQVVILHRCRHGRFAALAILGPGAAFGDHTIPMDYAASRVVALERAVVWSAPVSTWHYYLSDVHLALWHTQLECICQTNEQYEAMAYQALDRRLAALLLRLSCGRTAVNITHQLIAEILGTYRESISFIMRDLKNAGMVVMSYGQIQLTDVAGLQELADPYCWPMRQPAIAMAR
jgi:CRP-like cAMP-binding protein